jgi:hypothetical protein
MNEEGEKRKKRKGEKRGGKIRWKQINNKHTSLKLGPLRFLLDEIPQLGLVLVVEAGDVVLADGGFHFLLFWFAVGVLLDLGFSRFRFEGT